MPRHARNSTANAVYTYHERQKDTQQSGYGSDKVRLGKDSIKDFDCCSLTLQPCQDPVVTNAGFLYDKAALLEYVIHKKREYAQMMKAYNKQLHKEELEKKELAKAEEESRTVAFVKHQCGIGARLAEKQSSDASKPSISNMQKAGSWYCPATVEGVLGVNVDGILHAAFKPMRFDEHHTDETVYCPMSGKPLKLKHLTPVVFTAINDRDETTALINKQARYVCAVTNDVLGNTVPCAVLKTSGCVVTMECVEKLIKKDMLDPINSKPMKSSDIIPLQTGSGFSGSGVVLEAKKARPVMQA